MPRIERHVVWIFLLLWVLVFRSPLHWLVLDCVYLAIGIKMILLTLNRHRLKTIHHLYLLIKLFLLQVDYLWLVNFGQLAVTLILTSDSLYRLHWNFIWLAFLPFLLFLWYLGYELAKLWHIFSCGILQETCVVLVVGFGADLLLYWRILLCFEMGWGLSNQAFKVEGHFRTSYRILPIDIFVNFRV